MTESKRVVVAAPRGYCAGVDRAVVTVERALDLYCGVGLFAGALVDAGCVVFGAEFGREAVRQARLNVPEARFVAADLSKNLSALPPAAAPVRPPPPAAASSSAALATAGRPAAPRAPPPPGVVQRAWPRCRRAR